MAEYTIFCVLNDEEKIPFSVKIHSSATIDELKKKIKEEEPVPLRDVRANNLLLYKVDISVPGDYEVALVEPVIQNLGSGDQKPLNPIHKLSKYYPSIPLEETIHIIALLPNKVLKRKQPETPSSELPLAEKRRRILNNPQANVPPSEYGRISHYHNLNESEFVTHHPPRFDSIPLTLMDLTFAEFAHNAENIDLNENDCSLVLDLRREMTKYWDSELKQCEEFRKILRNHYTELDLVAAQIGSTKQTTDGHIGSEGLIRAVCEGKAMNGQGYPEVQASAYILSALRQNLRGERGELLGSAFLYPSIIVYFTGSIVGFAGTVFTNRFELGVLTNCFPLHVDPRAPIEPIARAFAAFREANKQLEQRYNALLQRRIPPNPTDCGIFLYKTSYTVSDGKMIPLTYQERLDTNKLIFLATDGANRKVVVKFTRKYGTDAHRACSNAGVAPFLHAVESLLEGWHMVVMDYLDPATFSHITDPDPSLKTAVLDAVSVLHKNGYVHGDLRGVNMMKTEKDGKWVALLLDFDWAGARGTVRYPLTINRSTVRRPPEVQGGQPIEPKHDLDMINILFSSSS